MIVKGTKQLGSFKRGVNIYVPKKKIIGGASQSPYQYIPTTSYTSTFQDSNLIQTLEGNIPAYFQIFTSIDKVLIGNSASSIGTSAFIGCANLTNIIIPSNITNIYGYTFASTPIQTVYCYGPKTIFETATFQYYDNNLLLTIHARVGDDSWIAGSGLTMFGRENVTVILDLVGPPIDLY